MASQKRLIKKKRAGVVLSREEVKEIKKGRKKLRRELRARGIRKKAEFEMTAGSLGLYFDKRGGGLLAWLGLHWLGSLFGALLLGLGILFLFSLVNKMRGYYTVNLSDGMFREGFVLSETADFAKPAAMLFASPAEEVPCISIAQLPVDIDSIDGQHNDAYFAYTYYIRNEGSVPAGYRYELNLNSESLNVSEGAWVVLFEDGNMRLYAKANRTTGKAEALPALDDNTRGYVSLPIRELAPDSDQFQLIAEQGQRSYYRVIPDVFESDLTIASGSQSEVEPMEVHKYTVVLYLEGDDVDTTDALIGGHLGVEMNFRLVSEVSEAEKKSFRERWESFWAELKFW